MSISERKETPNDTFDDVLWALDTTASFAAIITYFPDIKLQNRMYKNTILPHTQEALRICPEYFRLSDYLQVDFAFNKIAAYTWHTWIFQMKSFIAIFRFGGEF